MNDLIALLVGVAVVLLITAVTAYFVAQEFAYMAVDRTRLAARAAAGDEAAIRTLAITRRTSFMLSGAQLGITVTGLLVGYIAEPLIGESIARLVSPGRDATIPPAVSVTAGALIALLFSTVIQMLLGELLPKNLAIARPDATARRLSRSTAAYLTLCGPVIWVFDKAADLLLRALRIAPVHDVEHSATARDLEHIVEDSAERGDLPAELSLMVDRIIDFPRRQVSHAMIPRAHVDVVHPGTTLADLRLRMARGHSRYPVLDPATEEVVGVVHLLDILGTPDAASSARLTSASARVPGRIPSLDWPVSRVMREPLIVSHLTPLPQALRQLHHARAQLACVIDEYGGFSGVLALEDLAEELVGEITDEHDPGRPDYEPIEGDGIWVMPGDVHLDEVERALGVDLPRSRYETIAGLAIAVYADLPPVGARIRIRLPDDPGELVLLDTPATRHLHVEVLAVDRHVPSRVRLTLSDPDADADAEPGWHPDPSPDPTPDADPHPRPDADPLPGPHSEGSAR